MSSFVLKKLKSTPSTMDAALEWLPEISDKAALYMVQAETQRQGRGRMQRLWHSPPGGFYATVIFPIENEDLDLSLMGFVLSLALYEAVASFSPDLALSLKWPNDLLCGGAKIAGLLLERHDVQNGLFLLAGMGVNLIESPQEGIPYQTTSLFQELHQLVDPETFQRRLLPHISAFYGLYQRQGFEAISQLWMAKTCPMGTFMKVSHGEGYLQGIFCGMDKKGFLCLQRENQEQVFIGAGDVFF